MSKSANEAIFVRLLQQYELACGSHEKQTNKQTQMGVVGLFSSLGCKMMLDIVGVCVGGWVP